MPLVGLGVLILWLGWFGFNPGSTLGAIGNRFAEVALVTNLAAAAGVLAAVTTIYALQKTVDIGMAGNGAIAGLVAITAPSGYVEFWAAPIIGAVAGVIVVFGVLAIEKVLDDPVGALSAHGLAGIWGTLSCGIFTSPRYAELNAVGDPGLWYSGSFHQLGAQALGIGASFAFAFGASLVVFALIKATIGLRVTAEQEEAGLDIVEHGMYGYPELFIPEPDGGSSRFTPGCGTRTCAHSDERQCSTTRAQRDLGGTGPHEEDRSIHTPRGVRADPDGAAREGIPIPLGRPVPGIGTPEGDHGALSGVGADHPPPAEDEARDRGR